MSSRRRRASEPRGTPPPADSRPPAEDDAPATPDDGAPVDDADTVDVAENAEQRAADPAVGGGALAEVRTPSDESVPDADGVQVIDLVPDELTLARAQLDAGQPGLAEGTLRRRLAWLEAEGAGVGDEPDALRALLAEALWRQARPMSARQSLEAIRASSPQRRLPMAMIVEAEALAASGEPDRAAGTMERVVAAVGADAVFELRAGAPGRLAWPLPGELEPRAPRPPRAPWSERDASRDPGPDDSEPDEIDDERIAAGRARLEEARVAYVAGDRETGDAEMSIAVRLDPGLAADGVAILEPTLGRQPAPERLLLYGDLLRAAGREVEAAEAYDRAAGQRS